MSMQARAMKAEGCLSGANYFDSIPGRRYYSVYNSRAHRSVGFWLNDDETVPITVWHRLPPADLERLKRQVP